MKYFGFIKEHNNNKFSVSIDNLIDKDTTIKTEDRELVINYLKKGMLCVPLMGFVEDLLNEDNSFTSYISILTDGTWCWPEYIISYIENYPNFKIEEKFLKYIQKKSKREVQVSEEKILILEKQILLDLGFK